MIHIRFRSPLDFGAAKNRLKEKDREGSEQRGFHRAANCRAFLRNANRELIAV